MPYYARITDPVGLTTFIEETARKIIQLREFNSFCKLGKESKDSLSLAEHLCPPSVNWRCRDGRIFRNCGDNHDEGIRLVLGRFALNSDKIKLKFWVLQVILATTISVTQ
jgi:hypothetical protein